MLRTVAHRSRLLACVPVVFLAPMLAAPAGCETTGSDDTYAQYAEMLPQPARETIDAYLADLAGAETLLASVQTRAEAFAASSRLSPIVARMQSAVNTLESYAPGTQELAKQVYADRLTQLTAGLDTQIDRIRSTEGLAQTLGPAIDQLQSALLTP